MINGNYHFEDKRVIIDIADISSTDRPFYEVMKLRVSNGAELESYTTCDMNVAVLMYNKMVQEQTEQAKPLSGKYAKLRDDLVTALEAASSAAVSVEDTGTCNLDAASLLLPRWNENLVRQAAKEAGTSAFAWSAFGGKRFVFSTPSVGQARKNEVAAEAMTKALSDLGYNAFCYQQMD